MPFTTHTSSLDARRLRRATVGLLSTALLFAFAAPSEALAQQGPQSRFIYSPIGPGEGHGTIGMGGRAFFVIPTYDLNYVRGLTNSIDFTFGLDTLGIISFADLGLRARLAGDPDSGFALGVRAAVTPIILFVATGNAAAGGVSFGLTPGAVVSFGSRATQFSLSLDVPIFLGGAGFATDDGSSGTASTSESMVTLRPAATIEFPVSDSTNMYVQAQGYVVMTNGSGVLAPIVAVGAAW